MSIKRHVSYAKYVIKHKWYVFKARSLTGVSLWRALTHDLSKLTPSQWFPYARCFYDPVGSKQYVESPAFNRAWSEHQKHNKHHWQAWTYVTDNGSIKTLKMPDACVKEMLADWIGAGLAINGKLDVWEWYEKKKSSMVLHPDTRSHVEELLSELKNRMT